MAISSTSQTRPLGQSTLELTPIGLGAWAIGGEWRFGWGPQEDADSIATIRRAVVRDLHYGRLLVERTDVIHLHWPDLSFLSGPRLYRHVCRLALFYGSLALTRRRGTALVWTVHNVAAHEERSTARLRAQSSPGRGSRT